MGGGFPANYITRYEGKLSTYAEEIHTLLERRFWYRTYLASFLSRSFYDFNCRRFWSVKLVLISRKISYRIEPWVYHGCW